MSGGDFLSRWARRKREVEAVERPESAAQEPAATEPEAALPEMSDEEIALLPPLDALTAQTDLAQFLRAGVPTLLRNAALRRMWSLDPSIRDYVSEAREYAYDWNVAGGVPGQGPMLATDDIQAMLRDIFDGAPEPPPQRGTAESQAGRDGEPGAPPSFPPPAVEPTARPRPDSAEESAPDPAPTPSTQARMRRHGGAIPI